MKWFGMSDLTNSDQKEIYKLGKQNRSLRKKRFADF